jgi:probable phosphoglycerate mutase
MLRARQTAEIVCASLDARYEIYEQFAERSMGVYEGLTRDEARERYPNLWNRQCTSKPDDAPDGGETLREACGRIDNGMEKLVREHDGKSVLLICHGFAARAVHRFCCGLSFEEMAGFTLGNCEIANYTLENNKEISRAVSK